MSMNRQIIYSNDIADVAEILAVQACDNFYLQKFPDKRGEPIDVDDFNTILRRVFHPKMVNKVTARLLDRGNMIVRGNNPNVRPSIKRRQEMYMNRMKAIYGDGIGRIN